MSDQEASRFPQRYFRKCRLKNDIISVPAKRLPPDVNTRSVFANTELNLGEIEVYGFDYDYTLATYRSAVEEFIYAEAKKALVYKFKVRICNDDNLRGHLYTERGGVSFARF